MKKLLTLITALLAVTCILAQVDSSVYDNTKEFVDTIGNAPNDMLGLYTFIFSIILGVLTSETVKLLPFYGKIDKFVTYIAYALAIIVVFVVFGVDINFAWTALLTIISGQGYYQIRKKKEE
ncbi:MAG: hypothetical protein D6694_15445 [Gammaproteobacteria bacterium]|nr:MAG: hypothetical protein D6694_15445 [Gammaproteobacteria bacterium]